MIYIYGSKDIHTYKNHMDLRSDVWYYVNNLSI